MPWLLRMTETNGQRKRNDEMKTDTQTANDNPNIDVNPNIDIASFNGGTHISQIIGSQY